jgi:hypothetical protein
MPASATSDHDPQRRYPATMKKLLLLIVFAALASVAAKKVREL